MLSDKLRSRIKQFLEKNRINPSFAEGDFIFLAGGGSDRCFYRVKCPEDSYVLMVSPGGKREITAFMDVGSFLFNTGIGVPEIIDADEEGSMVLLEDLGDDSLYQLLKKAKGKHEVKEYYERVMMFLAEMQIRPSFCFDRSNYLRNRSFGYESFRWETDYFIECFVRQFCGMSVFRENILEEEFNALALCLDKEPKYFMHRDFQSQNIHFKNGRVKVIDFQTASRGLLQYDLASLLKDAYFKIDSEMQEDLLDYYMDVLNEKWGMRFDRHAFVRTFHLAGLQRNMQALGAFSFLGLQKKKTAFIRHIPAGLNLLAEALDVLPDYPVLKETVSEASELIVKEDLLDQYEWPPEKTG